MGYIRLIDWNTKEIESRTAKLAGLNFEVDASIFDNQSLQKIKTSPPAAVVIALDRRPSQGRDVAMFLRKTKATRFIPLILVGGKNEKVMGVREHLPDAAYTTWESVEDDLLQAISNPLKNPVVPKSLFDPYRGTPLPKKLGIKSNNRVGLVDAPEKFESTLGDLPESVSLVRQPDQVCDIVIWFVRQKVIFDKRFLETGQLAETGALWVVWPKKSSEVKSDLSQPVVRKAGLDLGMVDYKICSVDKTWTGLCFRWRKESS